jgi:hypothetical protein
MKTIILLLHNIHRVYINSFGGFRMLISTTLIQVQAQLHECIISIDPITGECSGGFDLTLNGQECIRIEEVDCNQNPDHPF